MKLVHSILILMPLLGHSACKTKTTSDSSDTLAASKPESALNSLSSGLEFCDPNEGAGANSCEKVLQDFMSSPKYKGKELLISCGNEAADFDDGPAQVIKRPTLDGPTLEALLRRIRAQKAREGRCGFGFRPAD